MPQVSPRKPGGHSHMNPPTRLIHVPPLRQEILRHSSMSEEDEKLFHFSLVDTSHTQIHVTEVENM